MVFELVDRGAERRLAAIIRCVESFLTILMASTMSVPMSSTGETRKRMMMRRLCPAAARRVLCQNLDVARRRAVRRRQSMIGLAEGIELDFVRRHDHVGVGHLAQFLDLRVREGGLRRAAPPQERRSS